MKTSDMDRKQKIHTFSHIYSLNNDPKCSFLRKILYKSIQTVYKSDISLIDVPKMRSKTTIECLQTEISGWTLPETFINEHCQDFNPFRDRNKP